MPYPGAGPGRTAVLVDRARDSGTGPRQAVLHRARAPEPAPVRGAARLFHRGPDRRQGRRRAGYTRASMASLLRDFRRRLQLFAPPGKPGPKTAPAKDRARARVTELRREGLSVYQISARLRAGGTPLNRTGVGQILAEEGFGRLLRGAAPMASTSPATAGRDTRLPRAAVIDFAASPPRRNQPGRPAAGAARPGIPGPARPDQAPPALPRHHRHPGGVLAAVPARTEADRHPAGLPRR